MKMQEIIGRFAQKHHFFGDQLMSARFAALMSCHLMLCSRVGFEVDCAPPCSGQPRGKSKNITKKMKRMMMTVFVRELIRPDSFLVSPGDFASLSLLA